MNLESTVEFSQAFDFVFMRCARGLALGIFVFLMAFVFPLSPAHADVGCFEKLLDRWRSLNVTSVEGAWETLSPDIQSTHVTLNHSLSRHPASFENPRTLFSSEKNCAGDQSAFVLAFSTSRSGAPLLEARAFDLARRTTALYQIFWNSSGELKLNRNPASCFHCHADGQAIFLGFPEADRWPFVRPDSVANARALETTLSRWNATVQSGAINPEKLGAFEKRLIVSALHDADHDWQTLILRYVRSRQLRETREYVVDENLLFREIFASQYVRRPTDFLSPHIDTTVRLAVTLDFLDLPRMVDRLSLPMRPDSFELSTATLHSLREQFPREKACETNFH